MKKEKENLRDSKLTCNINLYKIKSAEMFAEFISNEEEEFYMICPKCGSEMPDDSAFCTRCGASLHTGTQENQSSQGGPQQGNPIGPLLFSNAIHPMLDSMESESLQLATSMT